MQKNQSKTKPDCRHVVLGRKPTEQPDGFGRRGRRRWRSPGGQQPDRAGLKPPPTPGRKDQDQRNTKRRGRPCCLPPSPPQGGRAKVPVCVFQRCVVSDSLLPLLIWSKIKYETIRKIFLSTAGTDCTKLQTLPILNDFEIILIFFFFFVILGFSL